MVSRQEGRAGREGGQLSIDCEYTSEIVCPYCGYEFSDSWDVNSSVGDGDLDNQECDECGKTFFCRRDIDVSYVSEKLDTEVTG